MFFNPTFEKAKQVSLLGLFDVFAGAVDHFVWVTGSPLSQCHVLIED